MHKIYIYLHNRKIGTLAVNFNIAPKIVFYVLILMSLVATFGFRFSSRRRALFEILAHKFYNFTAVIKKRQIPSSGAESPAAARACRISRISRCGILQTYLSAKMRPRYECGCGLCRRIYIMVLRGSRYEPLRDLKQNFKPDAIQIKLSPRLKVCEIL